MRTKTCTRCGAETIVISRGGELVLLDIVSRCTPVQVGERCPLAEVFVVHRYVCPGVRSEGYHPAAR